MNKNLIFLGIVLSTLFWGSNFNVGSFVVSNMPPMTAAAERFVIASIVILLYTFIREKGNFHVLKNNFFSLMVLGVIGVTGFNLALFVGLKTTSATNGALIMAISPLSTVLISSLLERTKISISLRIGMLISLIGVMFVISQGKLDNIVNLRFSVGDIIILVGNICWATYTVGCRKYIKQATPLQITCFTMVFGTIGITIAALSTENVLEAITTSPAPTHLALLYMGVAGSVLAYLFWNIGLQNIGPAKTSIFFNLVPVFTMLITALSGAFPNNLQISGAILVISGVMIATGAYKMLFTSSQLVKT